MRPMSKTQRFKTFSGGDQQIGCRLLLTKKGTLIKLTKPLVYADGFVIPAGFVSDGCSMPPLLWSLLGHPFYYRFLKEAIRHDWYYKTQCVSRRAADRWFFRALDKPWLRVRRYLIYIGVRVGGWYAWWQNMRKKGKQYAHQK